MKVATFTVRATMPQSIAWKRGAESEGFPSVGAWIAGAVDAYLKARTRAGRPLPLAWRRGWFQVTLESGTVVTMRGMVSPPFGAYHGTDDGRAGHGVKVFSLVHLKSFRIIATLRTYAQCRTLASELAPLLLRDEAGVFRLAAQREKESV
jgi:hypothetical protein